MHKKKILLILAVVKVAINTGFLFIGTEIYPGLPWMRIHIHNPQILPGYPKIHPYS